MTRTLAPVLDSPPLVRYGLPELAYGVSPAAGANFTTKIDGSYIVRLVSVYVTLVTDGNAANRGVVVEYTDAAGARFALDGPPLAQTASTTSVYHFSAFRAEDAWPVDSAVLCKLTPVLLMPTFSWGIYVANKQVGDQLSTIRYVVERFFTTSQPPAPSFAE